jgi:hypothetical protein
MLSLNKKNIDATGFSRFLPIPARALLADFGIC